MELDIPKGGLNRNSRIVHSTCATPIALKHGHEYSGDVYRGETAGDEEDGLGVGVGEAVVCEGKGVGSAVRSTSVASVVSESAKTVSSTVPNTSTYAAHPSFTGTKQIRQNTMVNTSTSSKPRRVPTARPRKEPKVEEDMFGPIIKKSSP
ncbi:hypothetical protein EON65_24520 [archaeon]|nr:MAG: hypothetical protein EON65_24520 [archaeon]